MNYFYNELNIVKQSNNQNFDNSNSNFNLQVGIKNYKKGWDFEWHKNKMAAKMGLLFEIKQTSE